ncbi:hypothetical protein [Absidia glauca]|uniref:Uncharacterized protein n=1 Tax=Absidia glauca TaxID=4829 RepID=A0A168NPI0_ABSGL|nr:hypothetical protein [Absidia glauca]
MEAQADLVKQIRTTYASTPVAGRSPLTVDYIARTLPHLHLDRAANDEHVRRRRNSGRHGNDDHVEDGRQGPARGDSARQGNKDGNRSETKHSRRSRRRDRDSAFGRRSGTEQDNKKRKDNEEPAKKGMCRFCHCGILKNTHLKKNTMIEKPLSSEVFYIRKEKDTVPERNGSSG